MAETSVGIRPTLKVVRESENKTPKNSITIFNKQRIF